MATKMMAAAACSGVRGVVMGVGRRVSVSGLMVRAVAARCHMSVGAKRGGAVFPAVPSGVSFQLTGMQQTDDDISLERMKKPTNLVDPVSFSSIRRSQCKVAQLGLEPPAAAILKEIADNRYNANKDELRLVSSRYPSREMNRHHVQEVLKLLMLESMVDKQVRQNRSDFSLQGRGKYKPKPKAKARTITRQARSAIVHTTSAFKHKDRICRARVVQAATNFKHALDGIRRRFPVCKVFENGDQEALKLRN
ncbi:uncharacterized protein MONBRDRAFT_38152 [Monosiga brevicollis MX1]|uniref:Small ribosomal subunit protein mS35 mitochondrial conserved domain-containing protein n=1 Tax=Monosiga brevicollis TaxID=81824 RepID=A9V5Z5_MONBE|nr:uncharacterized protein MONBRDRAFT_38152 [Monosiga brevicollis MX1]EDQ86982.1 predicted protein [Monosiga brevicollis MX1]|eukprot:XP_001748221.1 hypothetical protein [Monosiga brevicollis MX1]